MQKQITALDILNDKKVAEIHDKIAPLFFDDVIQTATKYKCLELAEALLLVVLTIATSASTHICNDDYLASRKLIDEILDKIGDINDTQEGGNQ